MSCLGSTKSRNRNLGCNRRSVSQLSWAAMFSAHSLESSCRFWRRVLGLCSVSLRLAFQDTYLYEFSDLGD